MTLEGKILDFLPHKLQYCRISFNFGTWYDIPMVSNDKYSSDDYLNSLADPYIRDMYGNYKIRIREHIVEGQNIFIIETKNDYGIEDRRVVRITNNPMKLYAIPNSPMPRTSINPDINDVVISIRSDRTDYDDEPKPQINFDTLKIGKWDAEIGELPELMDVIDPDSIDRSSGASTVCAILDYTVPDDYFKEAGEYVEGEYKVFTKVSHGTVISQTSWNFWIDVTPPEIEIDELRPFSPDPVEGKEIIIAYNLSDNISKVIKNIEIELCNEVGDFIETLSDIDFQGVGRRFYKWNCNENDGDYRIKVSGTDVAGNEATTSILLKVDGTPPEFLIPEPYFTSDAEPEEIYTLADTSFDFTYNVSEDCMLEIQMVDQEKVLTRYRGIGYESPEEEEENIFSFNGFNVPRDGQYKMTVNLMDYAGNRTDGFVKSGIIIDRTPPVISNIHSLPFVTQDSDPAYQTTLRYNLSELRDPEINRDSPNITVIVEVLDADDGSVLKTITEPGRSTVETNEIFYDVPEIWEAGKYQFRVTATDSRGNESVAYADFIKDAVPPEITYPNEGENISGWVTIKGRAMDPDWTNIFGFRAYRLYYKKDEIATIPEELKDEELTLDGWETENISVPLIYRTNDSEDPYYGQKYISSRNVQNEGVLATFDTNSLDPGNYTILLIAEEEGTNGKKSCVLRKINVEDGDPLNPNVINMTLSTNPITFEKNSGSVLEIGYGLENKDANVSIDIIKKEGNKLVFHKYQENVTSSSYVGTPVIEDADSTGYYIWQDNEKTWHFLLKSTGAGPNTFSGVIVSDADLTDTEVIGIEEGEDFTFTAGSLNFDITYENGEREFLFKTTGDFVIPNLNLNGLTDTNYVFIGLDKVHPSTNPLHLNDLTAPETVEWDGRYLDTKSFVNDGDYEVVITALGTDNNGYFQVREDLSVITVFDLDLETPVPTTFYPYNEGDLNSTSIDFQVSEFSKVTVEVFHEGETAHEDVIATLLKDELINGGVSKTISWTGTYDDKIHLVPAGNYFFKVTASTLNEDLNETLTEVKDVTVSYTIPYEGSSTAFLEIETTGEKINNVDIAKSSSDFYIRSFATGGYFPPLEFTWNATLGGEQMVTAYPYVPFALQAHRHFNRIKSLIKTRVLAIGYDYDCRLDGFHREKGWADFTRSGWHNIIDGKCNFNISERAKNIGWVAKCYGTEKEGTFTSLGGIWSNDRTVPGTITGFGIVTGYKEVEYHIGWMTWTVNVPQYMSFGENMRADYSGDTDECDTLIASNTSSWSIYSGSHRVMIHQNLKFKSWELNPVNNRYYTWYGFVNKNRAVYNDITKNGEELITKEGIGENNFSYEIEGRTGSETCAENRWMSFPDNSIVSDESLNYLFDESFELNPVITPTEGGFGINPGAKSAVVTTTYSISPTSGGINPYTINWPCTSEDVTNWNTDVIDLVKGYIGTDTTNDTIPDFKKGEKYTLINSTFTPGEYDSGEPVYEVDADSIDFNTGQKNIISNQQGTLLYDEIIGGYLYEDGNDILTYLEGYASDYYNNVIINPIDTVLFLSDSDPSGIKLSLNDFGNNSFKLKAIFRDYDSKWDSWDDPLLLDNDGYLISNTKVFSLELNNSGESDFYYHQDFYPWESAAAGTDSSCFRLKDGNKEDNPYTIIDKWEIECLYPDNTLNNDFSIVGKDPPTPDNINAGFNLKLKLMATGKTFVEIKGKAFGDDLDYYNVYHHDGEDWKLIYKSNQWQEIGSAGENGTLCRWDVTDINGLQTVMLEVINKDESRNISFLNVYVGDYVDTNMGTVSVSYDRIKLNYEEETFADPDVVTITPLDPSKFDYDLDIVPYGPFVKIACNKNIENFNKPASLIYQYTPEETGTIYDTSLISLYAIDKKGNLKDLSAIFADHSSEGTLSTLSADVSSEIICVPLDSVPPKKVILNPIDSPTKEFTITVSGLMDSGYDLEIFIDDDPVFLEENDTTPPVSKTFTFTSGEIDSESEMMTFIASDLKLITEGNNYIFVTYKDVENRPYTTTYVYRDTIRPEITELTIIPNPFYTDEDSKVDINVTLSETGKVYFYLYDLDGSEIKREVLKTNDHKTATYWNGKINGKIAYAGVYLCRFYGVDLAGNHTEETLKYISLNTDLLPEIRDVTVEPNPFSYLVNENTAISFSLPLDMNVTAKIYDRDNNAVKEICYDESLSVGAHTFNWDGKYGTTINYVQDGEYGLKINAYNSDGVFAPQVKEGIYIDTVSPAAYISIGEPKNYLPGLDIYIISPDTKFTITSEDRGEYQTGIRFNQYKVDEEDWNVYNKSLDFSDYPMGFHILYCKSVDNAMNESDIGVVKIYLIYNPPVTEIQIGEPKYITAENNFITSHTPISFVIVDEAGGVKWTKYKIDNGNWLTYDLPFTLDGYVEGRHLIEFYSENIFGNKEAAKSYTVTIDDTPPETQITYEPFAVEDGKVILIKGTKIEFGGLDKGLIPSGYSYTQFRINSDEWINYLEPYMITALEYGDHTINYKGYDNLNNEEIWKSFSFELKPALEVNKSISNLPRALIYLNYAEDDYPSDENMGCFLRFMEDELSNIAKYDIVNSEEDFVNGLRSNLYNVYFISGNSSNLNDHISDELREQVYCGKGLIASQYFHFTGEGQDPELFGMEYIGQFPDENLTANLDTSFLTAGGIFYTSGKSYRIKQSTCCCDTSTILGEFGNGHPCVFQQDYGDGKTIYFAYDLIKSCNAATFGMVSEIIPNMFNFSTPDNTYPIPNGILPVEINVQSKVLDLPVKVEEIIPECFKIIYALPDAAVVENAILWNFYLPYLNTKKLFYVVNLPDIQDTFELISNVSYTVNGIEVEFDSISLEVFIENNFEEFRFETKQMVLNLNVEASEQHIINQIVHICEKLENLDLENSDDLKHAILESLKAIKFLRKIESVDISDVRKRLDLTMTIFEILLSGM